MQVNKTLNQGALAGLITLGLLLSSSGCTLNTVDQEPETDSLEQEYTGNVGTNPNPLTFWVYSTQHPEILQPALECALERIRNASCLPVDVSLDAAHWVRHTAPEDMGGRTGWTTGSWSSTRIKVADDRTPDAQCRILVHEIMEHVLRRSNAHVVSSSNSKITEPLLTAVCEKQDCGCYLPEL